MFRNGIGFPSFALPFFNMPDSGGGGGFDAGSGGGDPSPSNEPSAIDVDPDNTLIRIKGSDKPVKFSEHVKGFQAQATKAAQARAAAERQLAETRQRLQQYEQEKAAAAQRGNAGNQSEDVFQQLRQLPYLSGEQAVEVVQNITEQIKTRDMVMLGILKQMKAIQGTVGGLNETHQSAVFERKIDSFLSDGGLGTEWKDLAKEMYLAYEPGPELDEEFPTILSNRVTQIKKALEAERTSKLNAARRNPFVPGRGGDAKPSKPLELKANSNPRELTDELWTMLNKGSET